MAGYAARVAVEPSGSERDTMELLGKATRPVTPRGKQRASVGGERVSMELAGSATHLRRGYGAPGIEHVASEGMELLGKATHLRRGYGAPGIEHVAIGN